MYSTRAPSSSFSHASAGSITHSSWRTTTEYLAMLLRLCAVELSHPLELVGKSCATIQTPTKAHLFESSALWHGLILNMLCALNPVCGGHPELFRRCDQLYSPGAYKTGCNRKWGSRVLDMKKICERHFISNSDIDPAMWYNPSDNICKVTRTICLSASPHLCRVSH